MPNLGPWEIIIILVVLVLLFGAKKLPDAARSLGRSMRIFKSEVKEMRNDDEQQEQAAIQQAPQAQPQQQYQQPAPQAQPQQQYQQPYQPQPGQNNPGQPQQ
ncbi:Sec-independent protein translocase subunit TatA [uncultured Corynebacterium sp.]|mgnify:CR=1 FL=1|uniref:Sec-independent protein translocase subunit TatA n=1 Tax=uncultured Corynebacterium sp. TaxID=159447 RepID=UPI002803D30F|nr:Sec-independent protein translocase subunit TatA [uncultured Corynebacterium sp.]